MKRIFFKFGKIKLIILLVLITTITIIPYFMLKIGILCLADDDCIGIKCIDCGNICVNHVCTLVQCKDHGTFEFEKGCICNEGWTGRYCEKRIFE